MHIAHTSVQLSTLTDLTDKNHFLKADYRLSSTNYINILISHLGSAVLHSTSRQILEILFRGESFVWWRWQRPIVRHQPPHSVMATLRNASELLGMKKGTSLFPPGSLSHKHAALCCFLVHFGWRALAAKSP